MQKEREREIAKCVCLNMVHPSEKTTIVSIRIGILGCIYAILGQSQMIEYLFLSVSFIFGACFPIYVDNLWIYMDLYGFI